MYQEKVSSIIMISISIDQLSWILASADYTVLGHVAAPCYKDGPLSHADLLELMMSMTIVAECQHGSRKSLVKEAMRVLQAGFKLAPPTRNPSISG